MKFRFQGRKKSSSTGAPGQTGFREAAGTKKGRVFGCLFRLLFFGAGAFFCWFGDINSLLKISQSRSWPQVPCRIASSEVETNRSNDSNTYRVAITFTYQGREWTGGRYNFSDMSSSGHKRKTEVIRRFPPGFETVCWVNPASPTTAVLSRKIPGEIYMIIGRTRHPGCCD